jgi:hypothetical protein
LWWLSGITENENDGKRFGGERERERKDCAEKQFPAVVNYR